MTQPRYMPGPLTRRMTAAVVAAFFATTAGASASVDALSLAGVEGSPEWIAVLAHVGYAMSIDCSPPRACYAKSQWIRAYVHCPTRSLSVIERISMDLNGNVVNMSTAEPAPHSIAIATSGRRPS